MASVNTNLSALLALQSLNAASRDLQLTQQRINTGLKVSSPKDNGAIFAIAQTMRGELAGLQAANQSLARGESALEVAASATALINELTVALKERASAFLDVTQGQASRMALRVEMESLIEQIDRQAQLASFDGINFLDQPGVTKLVGRTWTKDYSPSPPSLRTPQSFLTPFEATSRFTHVERSMRISQTYSVPTNALTPDTFADFLPTALASNVVPSWGYSVLSGDLNFAKSDDTGVVRRDIYLDAFADGNAIEVWQAGQRLAATGQAYQADGAAVGPALAVAGPQTLSFLHDKALPFEIRSLSGGRWAHFGQVNRDPSDPMPSPIGSRGLYLSASASPPLPDEPLGLETAGAPASGGTRTLTVDGGAISGRVDMVFDAALTPDVVEIYQNGQRIAATGQPYVAGGAPVGAGLPVTGQQVISFDYDASLPRTLEFRFNENNVVPGNSWAVGGLVLQAPGDPLPSLSGPVYVHEVSTKTTQDTRDLSGPLPPLDPETEAGPVGPATRVIDAGDRAGRVDLVFDAFDNADVLEVWQSGVRIAASGQAYVAGGGGVAAGTPAIGETVISFDYDPTLGQALELRVNEGRAPAVTAWVVGGMVLRDPADPITSSGLTGVESPRFGVVYPDRVFIRSPRGDTLRVETRNLTAGALGLQSLDWSQPDQVFRSVQDALAAVVEAGTHFGVQQAKVGRMIEQNLKLKDVLEAGIGNLVDADLGKESAKLEAARTRQGLAGQTLSIANAQPQWILKLFGRGGG